MNVIVLSILAGSCVIMMIIERLGAPTTLELEFKGDVKRETRWLAQYGQAVCTGIAALLVWRMDGVGLHERGWMTLLAAVFGTSVASIVLKKLLGRVRPRHDNAGKFMGPSVKHANYRESFPSSHSACAVAMTVVLARLYPQGAAIFWALAITCAVLRYLMDAHWPSDVLGGIALGYGLANLAYWAMMPR